MAAPFSVRKYRDWSSLRSVLEVRFESKPVWPAGTPVEEHLRRLAQRLLFDNPAAADAAGVFRQSPQQLDENEYSIENLRGRPAVTLPSGEFNAFAPSTEVAPEELLLLRGRLSHPPLSIGDDADPELAKAADEILTRPKQEYELTPFEFRAITKFSSFVSRRTIRHTISTSKSDILSLLRPDASLADLLKDKDISIGELRIGLERFKSRVVFSVFGMVPTVREKLYFECSGENLVVFWEKSTGISHGKPDFEYSDLVRPFWDSLQSLQLLNEQPAPVPTTFD